MIDIGIAMGKKMGEKEREGKREKEGRLYNEGRMWEMEEEEGVKNEKDGDKPLAYNIVTVARLLPVIEFSPHSPISDSQSWCTCGCQKVSPIWSKLKATGVWSLHLTDLLFLFHVPELEIALQVAEASQAHK